MVDNHGGCFGLLLTGKLVGCFRELDAFGEDSVNSINPRVDVTRDSERKRRYLRAIWGELFNVVLRSARSIPTMRSLALT